MRRVWVPLRTVSANFVSMPLISTSSTYHSPHLSSHLTSSHLLTPSHLLQDMASLRDALQAKKMDVETRLALVPNEVHLYTPRGRGRGLVMELS